ncbi:hypothetical protein [Pseudoalteromonas piscicida]
MDGEHQNETVSIIKLTSGKHQFNDGSIWVVGTTTLNAKDQLVSFDQQMKQTPYLFISGLSYTNNRAYTVRAKNVNQFGFSAKLQYQEETAGQTPEAQEVVYIAIYAPNKEGELDNGKKYKIESTST